MFPDVKKAKSDEKKCLIPRYKKDKLPDVKEDK